MIYDKEKNTYLGEAIIPFYDPDEYNCIISHVMNPNHSDSPWNISFQVFDKTRVYLERRWDTRTQFQQINKPLCEPKIFLIERSTDELKPNWIDMIKWDSESIIKLRQSYNYIGRELYLETISGFFDIHDSIVSMKVKSIKTSINK